MVLSKRDNASEWRFVYFGLIVTGKGEREFLPDLFRSVAASGRCTFKVIRRIGQRGPITSPKRKLRMLGSGKEIPDRDANEIGLPARSFLSSRDRYVLLIDDLEPDRSEAIREVFGRYRAALDTVLSEEQVRRSAVHFLVNMLEAYYFADTRAVNEVLGTELSDFAGDVESIRHPKNELKKLSHGFDERDHGRQVVRRLDVPHVLSREDTCASLRTMFAWIYSAIGELEGTDARLLEGRYSEVTRSQISSLREVDSET